MGARPEVEAGSVWTALARRLGTWLAPSGPPGIGPALPAVWRPWGGQGCATRPRPRRWTPLFRAHVGLDDVSRNPRRSRLAGQSPAWARGRLRWRGRKQRRWAPVRPRGRPAPGPPPRSLPLACCAERGRAEAAAAPLHVPGDDRKPRGAGHARSRRRPGSRSGARTGHAL